MLYCTRILCNIARLCVRARTVCDRKPIQPQSHAFRFVEQTENIFRPTRHKSGTPLVRGCLNAVLWMTLIVSLGFSFNLPCPYLSGDAITKRKKKTSLFSLRYSKLPSGVAKIVNNIIIGDRWR